MLRYIFYLFIGLCIFSNQGCVKRVIEVRTEPPGAEVWINGVRCGTTPVRVPFTFYGTYHIVIEKKGYKRLDREEKISPPWYEHIPVDLVADLVPKDIKDIRVLEYTLEKKVPPDINKLLERSQKAFAELKKSRSKKRRPKGLSLRQRIRYGI